MTGVSFTLRAVALVAAAAVGACAGSASRLCPAPPDQPGEPVFLVGRGWHAGLVLPTRVVALGEWPVPDTIRHEEQVEIGWGDRDFYMASDPGWSLAVAAVLLPNESVLHVVWLGAPVEVSFPGSEILEVRLSATGMERLSRHIAGSFARDQRGRAVDLGASLYGNGRFYLSRERYSAFNTCNVWVARALQEAGCPIRPAFALTVSALMARVRPFGRQVQAVGGR